MRKDYSWLNEASRVFMAEGEGYLPAGKSAEVRIKEIADNAEVILKRMHLDFKGGKWVEKKGENFFEGFSEKFEHYMARGYYSLSTPIWVNFGNSRGLPVSCFGSYVNDDLDDIFDKVSEVGKMSKLGGGTSGYFGDLRPRGAKINSSGGFSSGAVHFMELFDTTADVVSQGSARRGAFAAYLPVDHPDIMEFLQIGSEGHPIQKLQFGVTISDQWLNEMMGGDKAKKLIWEAIITKRFQSGFPYIMFSDTVNNAAPQVYKDLGKKILASNLCSEIALASDKDNSFVCVLSSINLLYWEEIEKTDAVETLIYFLDAVNEEFVNKTEGMKNMGTAHNFAKTQRALGAGALGWHSLLQSKMIPFESFEAKMLNGKIWSTIRKRADKATEELAVLFGEPELLKGYGRRNVTTLAVAPTTSSSFILGQVSQSIEPHNSNYYTKTLAKGKYPIKNLYLKEVLAKYGKDTKKVWEDILIQNGSVQHLEFLTQLERDVFKTFDEIDQLEIIIQAGQRQKDIDQGQSLNLKILPKTSLQKVGKLLIEGWRRKVKAFYYQRSANKSQQLARELIVAKEKENECKSCEA